MSGYRLNILLMDMESIYYIGTYYIWGKNRRRLTMRISHRNFGISSARSAIILIVRRLFVKYILYSKTFILIRYFSSN